MSRWNIQELGKVSSIHNGSTPSTSVEEFWNGNIIWITPKDLSEQNRKYIEKGERFITKKGLSKVKSKLLPKGTLLLSSRAPIGLLSIAKNELVTNQGFKNIIVDENQISNEFLYYYLKLKVKELNNLGTGTTFKELSKSSLEKFKVKLPDLPTQQKIASVLSVLDDKIELNNRINAELEAMAKTLYDYWFVQFDFPIVTSSGVEKPYKTSGGKMVYNETLKREIPEGWEVKRLEEIEEKIITGKTPSTKIAEYFNGNIPFITIDDIRKQFYIFNAERNLTISGAESQVNKYVYSGDICVSCIGTIGIIGIVATTSQTNQQINTISQIKDYNRYFLLNSLKNYFEYNVGAKKGAVLDNMNKQEFSNIPILDANKHLKELYFDKVNPLYEKIKLNLKQNQELSALRDWLLPMLMNGQVKVE